MGHKQTNELTWPNTNFSLKCSPTDPSLEASFAVLVQDVVQFVSTWGNILMSQPGVLLLGIILLTLPTALQVLSSPSSVNSPKFNRYYIENTNSNCRKTGRQNCSTVGLPQLIDFPSVLTRQYTVSFLKATYPDPHPWQRKLLQSASQPKAFHTYS